MATLFHENLGGGAANIPCASSKKHSLALEASGAC